MMKKVSIKKFIIDSKINIRQAMRVLDDSHRKILFIANNEGNFFGSLSDGDIRRWILDGGDLNEGILNVCNKDPITFSSNYEIDEIKNSMLKNRIQAIPIIDNDCQIIDILFWDNIFEKSSSFEIKGKLDLPVVIMAGGAGTRLEPFTKILPKPLIPIGEKTVTEIVIDRFREYSINKFYLSVFHKSKMIKAYFDELDIPYSLSFLEEDKPLGTVGVLHKIKNLVNDSIFLTNCDTIINCNYSDLVSFHDDNNYDITLVGSMISHKVPYGICEIESGGKLVSIKEKPEFSYLVSSGMYLLRKTAINKIPNNKYFNITDLIKSVRDDDGTVGVYPISEKSWLDTGEWKEYKKTVEYLTF